MSIFPKRATRNSTVTIHWNFNTSRLTTGPIFPFVRIGVKAPDGEVTMLMEEHLLVLPNPVRTEPGNQVNHNQPAFLPKNTPLLVLASYLQGKHQREELVEMLEGMQSGKHYYFTFPVSANAPLGKYTLISEVHLEGQVKYSKTAPEDFFFVEEVQVASIGKQSDGPTLVQVTNSSPEPVPVKIVEFEPGKLPKQDDIRLMELPPTSISDVIVRSSNPFLLYNEERKLLPLFAKKGLHCLRNQQLLSLPKKENGNPVVYLLSPDEEEAYQLEGKYREIWEKANGFVPVTELFKAGYQLEYQEMLQANVIQEISF